MKNELFGDQVNANQAELQELEATEQHLKRQQATLTDRLSRLENQSALKREAAVSAVEEQLKEKEAIEAENAAARAKIAENEAMVCMEVYKANCLTDPYCSCLLSNLSFRVGMQGSTLQLCSG